MTACQVHTFFFFFFTGLTLCVPHFCAVYIKIFLRCYASHQACIFFLLIEYDWSSIFSAETTEHLPVNTRFLQFFRKRQQTTEKACRTIWQLTLLEKFLTGTLSHFWAPWKAVVHSGDWTWAFKVLLPGFSRHSSTRFRPLPTNLPSQQERSWTWWQVGYATFAMPWCQCWPLL